MIRGAIANTKNATILRFAIELLLVACALAIPQDTTIPQDNGVQLPATDEVKQRIAAVEANETIAEPEQIALLKLLNEALISISQIEEGKALLPKLVSAAEQATDSIAKLKAKLDQPLSQQMLPGQSLSGHSVADLEQASLETLRTGKREAEAQLASMTQQLQTLQSTIRSRREESQALPQQIVELQAKVEALRSSDAAPEQADAESAAIARMARDAAIAATNSKLEVARQKLLTYEAESELLPLQQTDLERQISATKSSLEKISSRLSNERKVKITEEIAKFNQMAAELNSSFPLATETEAILAGWPLLIDEVRNYDRKLVELTSKSSSLKSDFEKTQSLVESDLKTGVGLSRGVGFSLERKRGKLPASSDLAADSAELSKAIDAVQELLARTDAILDEVPDPSTLSDTLSDRDRAIVSQRNILQQIESDAERLFYDTLNPMGVELDTYEQTVEEYRDLINEHLLWVKSDQPLGLNDVLDGFKSFGWFFQRQHWLALGTAFSKVLSDDRSALFTGLLIIALLFAVRPWFSRLITEVGEQAQKRTPMAMRPTFIAMAATIMQPVPIAICFGLPGRLLANGSQSDPFVNAFSDALFVMAALILPLEFFRQFIRPCGVAVAHFGWPQKAIIPVRNTIRWIMGLLLPLIFMWRIYEWKYDLEPGIASLSRILFSLLMVISAVLIWRLSHPRRGATAVLIMAKPDGWLERLRWVWHPLLAAVPIGLGVLMVIGYGYSAIQLASRLYYTIWIFISVAVLYGFAIRWLTISRRQLAIQQLRARQPGTTSVAKGQSVGVEGGPVDVFDDKQADLSTINLQTRRLIDAAVFVGILVVLYFTWSSVLPALGFLDRVELWSQEDAAGTIIDTVTLSNLLLAIPMIILTFVIVRNVPGLLETTLLQRLPLENAVRYAITTLTSYVLAAVGIFWAAGTLGLHWSSIQWLVAGLGVGLGFGLQEIFANFISGIILLFEQPIRVGDVVTLDGTTGIVSRIRMRATTITNWDRQEYVVPNKDFITGRLVNWTLSDTTNRVVVNVGIAYGSDTRKACKILEEICRDHPNVLDDPPTLITFEGFGDSTLNIVVRLYLATLDGRLRVIHEIHTAIDDRFKEAGIEIAFPQRDLHIRSIPEMMKLGGENE